MQSRASRGVLVVALLLTLVALVVALVFVRNTTGGTLFLFTTVTPGLVIISVCLLLGVLVCDYRHRHRLFEIQRFKAGETIFRQGDEGDCVYFIRSGRVEVVRDGSVVATSGVGEYVGEMALIANSPRNATVRTVTDTVCAVLGKDNFLEVLRVIPASEEAVLTTIRKRAMNASLDSRPE
jgi:CRP-like cAMP-binding protein